MGNSLRRDARPVIAPGTRFGNVVALNELSSSQAGKAVLDGSWCWIRCDCGTRRLVRSRHLRAGIRTCANNYGCRFAMAKRAASSRAGGIAFTKICKEMRAGAA